MTKHPNSMTGTQYSATIAKFGLTPYAAARVLGVSLRQSHRYASGESAIPRPVVKLLRLALRYRLTADQLAAI
jgi:hypothetical protein